MLRYAMGLLALSGFWTQALADPQPWMKRDNSAKLGLYTQVHSSCIQFDISDLVRGVLTRHRMTAVSFTETADLWLDVQLHCIDSATAVRSFLLRIEFHTMNHGSEMSYSSPYTGFGRSDSNGIRLKLRDQVEAAVADYLEAQQLF